MLPRARGRRCPWLGGVIHAAAVFRDAAVVNYGWAQVRRILWPKVIGAWRLHRATRDLDLDFFVLFSSSSGVIGNTGQAAYGAANAFLDQLAGYRRALGLAGQAIAWGVWSDVGVAEGYRAPFEERLEKIGLGWFAPEAGFQALERLLREGAARSMFARVDWPVFVGAARGDQPLIGHLVGDSAAAGVSAGAAPGTLPARLDAVSGTEREALLVGFVQREVQSALRLALPPSPEVGFFDLGVDSVMAVELRNRLNRALGERYVLPNTAIFDYPTVAELAGHLAGQLSARPGTTGEFRTAPAGRTAEDPVAVVGMACRFPGSPDLAAFRNALRDGGNPVTRGRPDGLGGNGADPEDRPWGAYLADLDRFDPEFFRIAPVEAEFMDPQQRLLLENSWHALEEAGIAPVTLRGSRTGLYFGVAASSYAQMIQTQSLHAVTGNSTAAAVGRIAFTPGFRGPAIAVDTACSSSLVAIHQAVLGLIAGDADLALAGGVNTILSEESTRLLGTGLMLSENGRCRTFDAGADGIVRGEGCGVVVLKRLEDAERDGDRILGVVVGSAVNQDGASAGLTVPNGPAQEQVIRDALRRARIPATGVDYLEAHGTGTELGDPIELQAAAAVYGEGREPERPAADRIGEDEHRARGDGGGGCRGHQGAARDAGGGDPETPALRAPQPANGLEAATGAGHFRGDGMAGGAGTAGAGRGEFVRHLGDERAPDPGGAWEVRGGRGGAGGGRSGAGSPGGGCRPASPAGGGRDAACRTPLPRAAIVGAQRGGARGDGGPVSGVAERGLRRAVGGRPCERVVDGRGGPQPLLRACRGGVFVVVGAFRAACIARIDRDRAGRWRDPGKGCVPVHGTGGAVGGDGPGAVSAGAGVPGVARTGGKR